MVLRSVRCLCQYQARVRAIPTSTCRLCCSNSSRTGAGRRRNPIRCRRYWRRSIRRPLALHRRPRRDRLIRVQLNVLIGRVLPAIRSTDAASAVCDAGRRLDLNFTIVDVRRRLDQFRSKLGTTDSTGAGAPGPPPSSRRRRRRHSGSAECAQLKRQWRYDADLDQFGRFFDHHHHLCGRIDRQHDDGGVGRLGLVERLQHV